ncbi:hypothetical protein StoSoilB13_08550 [Arthrobacter sp. StoSoilB13]|nr:hypothetical protein StoSoilB13_08550 [Arthrobacter sp. StoSoilB13]
MPLKPSAASRALGLINEVVQDELSGAVVRDELREVVAFRGGVFRVRTNVQVQA